MVGENNFIAKKEGYDENVTVKNITSQTILYHNFTLRNGSCHGDCTDYYGNCNPACQGLTFDGDTCNIINTKCNYKPKGYAITILNTTTNRIHEYTCCEGPERNYPAAQATITGEVKDLVDYTWVIEKDGKKNIILHIAVFE